LHQERIAKETELCSQSASIIGRDEQLLGSIIGILGFCDWLGKQEGITEKELLLFSLKVITKRS
jgi:hypothetical protein